MKYRIGDAVIQIDVAEQFMHPNFKPFQCEADAEVDMLCYVAVLSDIEEAIQVTIGQLPLAKFPGFHIYEGALGLDLLYPDNQYLTSISINREQTEAQIYVVQDREGNWKDEFYRALKNVVLLTLERKGKFAMDASSILCDDRVILLSKDPDAKYAAMCVERGMGELFQQELTVCGIEDDVIYAYGTPWSAEANIQTERYMMGGIVFMKKSASRSLIDLPPDKRQLFMVVRCISPLWREGLLDRCLGPIQLIEPVIWIKQLLGKPDVETVDLLNQELASVFGGVRLLG